MFNSFLKATAIGAALLISFSDLSLAQKSKDTVRIALSNAIRTVDITVDPRPDVGFSARWVHDTLIFFDERADKFRPLLAKSWKQVDSKTYDFELRQGLKFHDGSAFDADDVVYTINWMIDPKTRSRAKTSWTWIKSIEKLGSHKVRFHGKRPTSNALFKLAYTTPIYPSDVHGAYKVKSDFGRKPVGLGPYRAVSVDTKKGKITLVPNKGYAHGGTWKQAANIGKIELIHIPDRQTQVAQLLTGGVDIIHQPQPAQR